MYKAYKFRLYPDSSQKQLLSKTFGCVRLIYNYFLDKCIKNGFINVNVKLFCRFLVKINVGFW